MQPKKILFANIPADGHFNPMTGIAMELKNQGHEVRWYTSKMFAEKLNSEPGVQECDAFRFDIKFFDRYYYYYWGVQGGSYPCG